MYKIIITFFSVLLLTSCSEKKAEKNYIARVNDSYLTSDDIYDQLEINKINSKLDRSAVKSVVTKWVKDEILFKRAQKEHFDKDEKLQKKMENYFKSLVIDEYLKYHFQSTVSISNREIESFYDQNKESYKLETQALKISHVFVEDYNDANTIKSVLQSTYNVEERKMLYKEYNFETRIIKRGEVVNEINAELFEKNISKIVGPISSDYGFHIIEIQDNFDKGDYLPLNFVRDDIYERLMQQKNKSEYIMFTDSIFSISDYEINEQKLEGIMKKQ